MPAAASARRKPANTPDKKEPEQKPKAAQRRALGAVPAYLQRKLAVGSVNDSAETEADRVADRVVQRAAEDKPDAKAKPDAKTKSPAPAQKPKQPGAQRKEVNAGDKLAAAEEAERKQLAARGADKPGSTAQEAAADADADAAPAKDEVTPANKDEVAQRKAEATSAEAVKDRKAAVKDEKRDQLRRRPGTAPAIQRQSLGADGGTAPAGVEQRLADRAGKGSPLPPRVRDTMEQEIGGDFSGTRVHTDAEANHLASELGAQAFTIGNDIYFNQGRYQPETPAGSHLLAHELTHVVQQGGQAPEVQRRIDPSPDAAYAETHASAAALAELENLELPAVKARHLPLYSGRAAAGSLKRKRGYTRGRPAQINVWRSNVHVDESAFAQRLQERNIPVPQGPNDPTAFTVHGRTISGSKRDILSRLLIPNWDRHGNPRNFQVDHIIELQVSGENGTGTGNSIENMELLDQPSNSSSGSTIMNSIYARVDTYLATLNPVPNRRQWLQDHDIVFTGARATRGGSAEGASAYWDLTAIEQAEPVRVASPPPPARAGTAREFVLSSGPGGIDLGRFSHRENQLSFGPGSTARARCLAGMVIESINLTDSGGSATANDNIGSIAARWALPDNWQPADPAVTLSVLSSGPYSGYVGGFPALNVDFAHMSPVSFPNVGMRDGQLFAEGTLAPSLSFFGTPITVTLQGGDVTFSIDYSPDDIRLPFPGVVIDDALVSVFYSTRRGFGLGGRVAFSIPNVGDGVLAATFSTGAGIGFQGSFDFDRTFFDQARVTVAYARGVWSGSGTIAVTTPNKVRGLKAASLTVAMEGNDWRLTGTADPAVPGVERAAVSVARNQSGIIFEGDLTLASSAAVRSGTVHVRVAKQEGRWSVAGTGTVAPNIPTIDSSASITFADGTFTAEATVSYNRGRLSGSFQLGVTNAAVGEDGRPTGSAEEGATDLTVFGGGELTLRITPWLEGTAGVHILPNGEIEVHGRIAVPQPVTVFDARRWDRTLLSVGLDIPIFGVSVAGQRIGIFCTIGGDLKLVAGIGPAQINDIALDVTYNPSHEDQAHVVGTATFHMPADAGLELGVHAAIGAGIPIVSAQAGIELSGKLGVEAALNVPLTVDWTPIAGLVIDAPISVTLSPMFTFAVNGYVLVEADLLFTSIELYRKDWNLASLSVGSGYELGMTMPFHYAEGEPFNPSLDDIQLTYPDIDPLSVLSSVFDRIT
jgi:hypothetical protein